MSSAFALLLVRHVWLKEYIYIAKESWFVLDSFGSSTVFVIPEVQVVMPTVVALLGFSRENLAHRNVENGLLGSSFCGRISISPRCCISYNVSSIWCGFLRPLEVVSCSGNAGFPKSCRG